MKKEINTPLLDEILEDIGTFRDPETSDFFYTRLKAKMEEPSPAGWSLPLKPVWIIGIFLVLLGLNSFMLVKQFQSAKTTTTESTGVSDVANIYDLKISSTTY